jgi:hypothetical protein
MSANKQCHFLVRAMAAMAAVLITSSAFAVPLDARSTSKINNAKAKRWTGADQGPAINPAQQDKKIVNFGSKKDNTCNLNIGTAPSGKAKPGQRQPKEIVVTTKDVINICK